MAFAIAEHTLATGAQVTNLLKNPSFEEAELRLQDGGWWTWAPANEQASSIRIDEREFIDGAKSLRVEPQGGTFLDSVVGNSPLPMTVGKSYTVSFWARAEAPRPFSMQMQASGGFFNWDPADFQVTTEWAEYYWTFAAKDTQATLLLYGAAVNTPFWLDFVNVYEGPYVAGVDPSGAAGPSKARSRRAVPGVASVALSPRALLPGSIIFRSGLALDGRDHTFGYPLVVTSYRDLLWAQLVTGTFVTPLEGATPLAATDAPDDKPPRAWTPVAANAGGWFKDKLASSARRLYATVDSPAERVMMLETRGCLDLVVNGEPRWGGPESDAGFACVKPVKLKAGTNEFLFTNYAGRPLAAKLVPAPSAAFISNLDILKPSLVAGHDTDGPVGVVVVNASVQPLSGARARIASDLPEKDSWVDLHVMPALTVKKIALPGRFTAATAGPAGSKHSAQVTLVARDGATLSTLTMDLVTISTTDRRNVTRISTIDDSVQYYTLVPSTASPAQGDPIPGILFHLHGGPQSADNAAKGYSPKVDAHVVCPTNRRPGGFSWEDWGRIDFTEALAHARANLLNDPRRSWLTGASMGGHGTWNLGAHFPDEFAAIAPTAAWFSRFSRAPFDGEGPTAAGIALTKEPAVAMLLRAGRAGDTSCIKENYLQQGVFVLHGDADEWVHVGNARAMFKALAAISHPDFQYYEHPGGKHVWAAQADWPQKMQFLFRHVLPDPKDITRVRFRTVAPQVSHRNAWVHILQQHEPFEVSSVDVSLDAAKRTITGTTSNVATLDLVPPIILPGAGASADITITLDGQSVTMTPKAGPPHLRFRREQGSDGKTIWSLDPSCRDGSQPPPLSASEKTPARGGPFKAAYTHRFIAVVGTLGDDDADALLMAKARYDADWWWHHANGRFEICTDTDFEPRKHRGRNVILYGNHDQNATWSKVLGDGAPIDIRNGAFVGPTAHHQGDDIGVLFVYPRADCDQSQVGVVAGTGAKGMRAAMRLRIYAAALALPDLVAFRAAILTDCEKGVIEAGFFGNDWSTTRGTWMRR